MGKLARINAAKRAAGEPQTAEQKEYWEQKNLDLTEMEILARQRVKSWIIPWLKTLVLTTPNPAPSVNNQCVEEAASLPDSFLDELKEETK